MAALPVHHCQVKLQQQLIFPPALTVGALIQNGRHTCAPWPSEASTTVDFPALHYQLETSFKMATIPVLSLPSKASTTVDFPALHYKLETSFKMAK